MPSASPKPFWSRPVVKIVSAVLLAAASLSGAWPLAFVALIPWFQTLQGTTPREAWRRGYGFGFLLSLTQLWWLGVLAYRWTESLALGILPWLLASALSAIYYGMLGRLIRSCYRLGAVWAIPFAWAGIEVFRSYIPVFAFPWSLWAEPLVAVPALAQGAWFGTIFGVSALAVTGNLLFDRLLTEPTQRAARVVPLLGLLGVLLLGNLIPANGTPLLKAGAGQLGLDMAFDKEASYKVPGRAQELLDQADGLDLLVLPEGLFSAGDRLPPNPPFRIPKGLAVVFGAQRGEGPIYQSAFALRDDQWSFADKTRLVIFGEFVPGRSLFPAIGEAFQLPGGDLSAGERLSALRLDNQTFGPLICFEALFPDLAYRQARERAQLLTVMSIDDWFQGTPAPKRLALGARWRAIESGLPVVRSGSLGRTEIIDASGHILADVPYGEPGLARAELRKGRGPFLFLPVFPILALLSLFVIPIAARRVGKASQSTV